MRRLALSVVASALILAAVTHRVSADHPAPGDIAFVDIGVFAEKPIVRFGRRQVLVYQKPASWVAIVALGSDILPGEYIVTMEVGDDPVTNVPFRVAHEGTVGLDQSALANVAATPGAEDRLNWEFTKRFLPAPPFARPVVGEILRDYALTDPQVVLSSTNGSSVLAPASGRIVAVESDGPGAQRVRIDHGHGVYSIITPIYDFQLAPDAEIYTGTRLGVAGAMSGAGRSGVAWRMTLNGELVNPLVMTRPVP